MDDPKKRRILLGLWALLAVGAVCAVVGIGLFSHTEQPPREVRLAEHGMTTAEMKAEFGRPYSVNGDEIDGFFYGYRFDWGDVNLYFRPSSDRCARVFFHYGIEMTWYEYHESGEITNVKIPLRAPL